MLLKYSLQEKPALPVQPEPDTVARMLQAAGSKCFLTIFKEM